MKQVRVEQTSLSRRWTNFVLSLHRPVTCILCAIAKVSATNPKRTIVGTCVVSFLLLAAGIMTNFRLDVDEQRLFSPADSYSVRNSNWLRSGEATFPRDMRMVLMMFHDEGRSVVGQQQVRQVFKALDVVRNVPGFDDVCGGQCAIHGVTQFWSNSLEQFEANVTSNVDVIAQLSAPVFPNGVPVVQDLIMGYATVDGDGNMLSSAQSFLVTVMIPSSDEAVEFENDAIAALMAQRDGAGSERSLTMEIQSKSSMGKEFVRAIVQDLPLVPFVFLTMSLFVGIAYARRNRIESRALLGIGAVVAVLLSVASGYGLLFIFGVPFTSITQILPFILFGIGLDDSFIIIGAFERTNSEEEIVKRIEYAIEDVGLSITLTTVTSALAFSLGISSSVPSVAWVCYYAAPTICVIFIYQLSFFIACIVLDEKRKRDNRYDCCFCCGDKEIVKRTEDTANLKANSSMAERVMVWYANKLLLPWVKLVVVVAFTVLFAGSTFSAMKFDQQFDVTDVLPQDSFVLDFLDAAEEYREVGPLSIGVYFRDVDQSSPMIRQEMKDYVAALVETDYVSKVPEYFWVDHFDSFVQSWKLEILPFTEQLDMFLATPSARELFAKDIVRDPANGHIIASTTSLVFDVDLSNVTDQILALRTQQRVSMEAPINQNGDDDRKFFTYDGSYQMWEFFAVVNTELLFTTLAGGSAVLIITLLFIPHWSAVLYVTPLIGILYVDLLGFMQLVGLHINAVSFVSLVMSIGLLVDFMMHILFRFYEVPGNRHEKTVEMLRSMGSSILLGGATTFWGILPLMFSTTQIFATVFYTFLGIVLLGMSHGLILLPVMLSMWGPEDHVAMTTRKERADTMDTDQYGTPRVCATITTPEDESVDEDTC